MSMDHTMKNEFLDSDLFQKNPEILVLIDSETLNIVDCNEPACLFYGYPFDEMLKFKITYFNPSSEQQILNEITLPVRSSFSMKHCLSGGEEREVEARFIPFHAENKNLLLMIISDITAQKALKKENKGVRTETQIEIAKLKEKNEALEKANMLHTAIIDSSPDMVVFALDCNYCYIAFNSKHKQTMKEIWGKDIKIGMNMLYDVIGRQDDRRKAKESFDRTLAGESFSLIQEYGEEKLKRLYWQIYWSPICSDKGNIIGLTCFNLDITERKRAEDTLLHGKTIMDAIFDSVPGVLYLYDDENNLIRWNRKHEDLTGYSAEELSKIKLFDWYKGDEKSQKAVVEGVKTAIREGFGEAEADLQKKDGSTIPMHFTASTLHLEGRRYFVGIGFDITNRKRLETSLANEKKLLETTLISIGDGVISTDNEGNIGLMNKVGEYLTGWTQEEAKGKPIEEVFHIVNELTRERSKNIVKKVIESGRIMELENHTILISKDGIERPIEDSAAPIIQEDGKTVGAVLVFRDFSEKKKKQETIEYLSYHDQLTGLYNRRYYDNSIKSLNNEKNIPLALIMADVNGLKLTNDAFGHNTGDILLKKIAGILKKQCREQDIAARIGGDEFILILPRTDSQNADKIIQRINAAITGEKIENVVLSVSIGIGVKQSITDDVNEVYKKAEDEMYRNKLSESLSMRSRTIDVIMKTLYEKNPREMLHSKRVGEICESIAKKMDFERDEVNRIKTAGLMHDIGKIGIDENILSKPGKLISDEWNEIMRHPEIGYRIMSSVNEFSEMANYILQHHERWDGEGYPFGLKGEEILMQSRIIAVADAYDAMTSCRTYSKALSEEEAIHEIKKNAGKQFDSEIAQIFIERVLKKN